MNGLNQLSESSLSSESEQPWYVQLLTEKLVENLVEQSASANGRSHSGADLSTLEWGRRYLPMHFRRAPSKMHLWLGEQLDTLCDQRGSKINVIGPRGGAKSTIGSLCYVLRMAVTEREPYIWIISDTKHQAQAHLENVKVELEENRLLAADYPQAVGQGSSWRATTIVLNNGVMIESFGTGQRIRGRRRRDTRPTLIVCDDLQNDGHTASRLQRENSDHWFQSTLLKAGTKQTNFLNLATALHRDALAMQLERTPGWQSARFRAVIEWPKATDLWDQWRRIYSDLSNPNARREAWLFYQTPEASYGRRSRAAVARRRRSVHLDEDARGGGRQSAFEREKQSSPIDPTRCEWPDEYFQRSHLVRRVAERTASSKWWRWIPARAPSRDKATFRHS